MSLKLGDLAPNFTADTTNGMINFYEWMSNSWTVFLSYPKDFTEVCTTELLWLSKNMEEFSKRNIKVISLSVDNKLIQISKWLDDIKNTYHQDIKVTLISDKNMRIAKLYGMIHNILENSGEIINSTARSIYIISPDKKINMMLTYGVDTGRNFNEVLRILDSLIMISTNNVATPANWQAGDDCIVQSKANFKEAAGSTGFSKKSGADKLSKDSINSYGSLNLSSNIQVA